MQFSWVLSLNLQVAVNCTVVPLVIDEVAGVTTIEVRVASVTVTVVEPETLSCIAVTVAVPTALPVSKPPGSTVAMPAGAEVQLALSVRSCVVPSL